MADWTDIPDATFDPDRPVLGSTHLAIVKNFEALAEGASGAPRIEDAALDVLVTNAGRDWVLNRTAAAQTGAVGTYAFAFSTSGDTNFGSTRAGSSLSATSAAKSESYDSGVGQNFSFSSSGTLSGTWRSMGQFDLSSGNATGATLWLRIS